MHTDVTRQTDVRGMTGALRVAAVVGSLRGASYTRGIVQALALATTSRLHLKIVEIGDLTLYNQDQEETPPEAWLRFRRSILGSDAVLFATPEYNRSVPGVLKNAIDIGSRPQGHSVWSGKPAAIISVSPGSLGAFGANQHLRQSLVFLDMPTLQQPEAYIGGVGELLSPTGDITHPATKEFLLNFLDAFEAWIRLVAKPSS